MAKSGKTPAQSVVVEKWQEIIKRELDPSSLSPDARYTIPRSYGVYAVSKGKTYRFGNHPVREWELTKEMGGKCKRLHLFAERSDAEEVCRQRNLEAIL